MRPPGPPVPARPEQTRPGRGLADPVRLTDPGRTADPIRSGRDALIASLERPLTPEAPPGTPVAPGELARPTRRVSAFDEDPDAPKEVPAVPSLAVLRPRAGRAPAGPEQPAGDKPRKRLPSWDDVLF